jgi:serine/threonine protein kinase
VLFQVKLMVIRRLINILLSKILEGKVNQIINFYRGKFANVKLCIDENTKIQYAMKIMNKKKLKRIFISRQKHAYNAVESEMAILKKLVNKLKTLIYSFFRTIQI